LFFFCKKPENLVF